MACMAYRDTVILAFVTGMARIAHRSGSLRIRRLGVRIPPSALVMSQDIGKSVNPQLSPISPVSSVEALVASQSRGIAWKGRSAAL